MSVVPVRWEQQGPIKRSLIRIRSESLSRTGPGIRCRSSAGSITGPSKGAAGSLARELSVIDDENAVDSDVKEPFAIAVGILEGRAVPHLLRIENYQVHGEAGLDQTAIGQSRGLGGEGRHLAHRFLQPKHLLITDIVSQDPRRRAPAAGVRSLMGEQAVDRLCGGISTEGDERVGERRPYVLFVHD